MKTGLAVLLLPVVAMLRLALAGPAMAAEPGEGFRTFVPDWRKGSAWTVKAQYRLRGGGEPGQRGREPAWSEPVTWKFRVMDRSRDRNLEVFRLRAECAERASDGFVFLAERASDGSLRSLALARAVHRATDKPGEPESVDYTRRSTGPHPVLNELTLAPGDFPFFDFPEHVKGPSRVDRFEITEASAGMYFSQDVTQRVEPLKLAPADERLKVKLPAGAAVLQYTVTRRSDRTAFRQLWTSSRPWFLHAESGSMRAWLIEPK